MKNLFISLTILFSVFMQAQETEFKLTSDKFTDYLVLPFQGKTEGDLYNKALQWIEVTYKNPKEVLKGNIENDYVRFQGYKPGLVVMNALGRHAYDGRYTIEITFKDGKCKFDLIDLEYYTPYSQYSPGGWNSFSIANPAGYFKKGELRSSCKYFTEIPDYFNVLKNDFVSFMSGSTIPSKKEGW